MKAFHHAGSDDAHHAGVPILAVEHQTHGAIFAMGTQEHYRLGKVVPLDLTAPVYSVQPDLIGVETATRAERMYVSHFATCPERERFRRRQSAKGNA